jgi:hypothetical protein
MDHGLFGLKYPRVDVAFKLLFGLKRGVFFLASVMIVAPLGLWFLWKRTATRTAGLVASAIFAYYWLLNASYGEWTAGLAYGPRIMGAGIPALCIGLAPAWEYFRARGRSVLLALLAVSVLFSLAAVSTTVQPPFDLRSPIIQLLLPSFWRGQLAIEQISMLSPSDVSDGGSHGAFNLGQLLGLPGLSSLLPLLAVWAIAAGAWMRIKASDAKRESEAT